MKRDDILTSPRLAGQVKRYHAWPVLSVQTVADHSYHCMRIWWEVFGPLPSHITTFFLWHDAGELVVGDLPFPVKSQNDVLKHAVNKLEVAAVKAMGGEIPELSQKEQVRVKACDLMEMHDHGCIELLLGNRFGMPIIEDTFAALEKLPLSSEDSMRVFKYVARMREFCAEVL